MTLAVSQVASNLRQCEQLRSTAAGRGDEQATLSRSDVEADLADVGRGVVGVELRHIVIYNPGIDNVVSRDCAMRVVHPCVRTSTRVAKRIDRVPRAGRRMTWHRSTSPSAASQLHRWAHRLRGPHLRTLRPTVVARQPDGTTVSPVAWDHVVAFGASAWSPPRSRLWPAAARRTRRRPCRRHLGRLQRLERVRLGAFAHAGLAFSRQIGTDRRAVVADTAGDDRDRQPASSTM